MNYISEYSAGDEFIAENYKVVVNGLVMAANSKGLKQADIAELTGFGTPKVNKIYNNRQAATADDSREIARAIGCVIRFKPNASNPEDGYQFLYRTDKFTNLLQQIYEAGSFSEACIIAGYEMVISILNELGLDAKDYVIHAVNRPRGPVKLFGEGSRDDGLRIMFTRRHIFKDSNPFEFGVMISPRNRKLVFGIWCDTESEGMLKRCRSHLDVSPKGLKDYDDFVKASERWIPKKYRENYVDALVVQGDDLDNAKDLENCLKSLFQEYCDLIKKETGKDIAERNAQSLSPVELLYAMRDAESFTPDTRYELLNNRESVCDVDPGHELFKGSDGKPYVEVMPIIPLVPETINRFGTALKSVANSAVLCPMCAAKLRHGNQRCKEDVLLSLYDKYQKQLSDAQMDISRLELFSWHSNTL